jgi:hypothetical protein
MPFTPAKATVVTYDITFNFNTPSLTDVVGQLSLNSPPLAFPGTFSGASLTGLISSFSVTSQIPPTASAALETPAILTRQVLAASPALRSTRRGR